MICVQKTEIVVFVPRHNVFLYLGNNVLVDIAK